MPRPVRILAAALAGLGWVLLVLYPLFVYVALDRLRPRAIALSLLVVLALAALLRRGAFADRGRLWAAVGPMLPAAFPLAAAAVFDDRGFLLAVPVLVNAALLLTFAVSLRRGSQPMVERFARLQEPDLPAGGIAYCRSVTKTWCAFFGLNGSAAAILAITSVQAWALYTGGVAYVAMALLFAAEYVVRRIRFRRYGSGPIDRLLALIFPVPSPEDARPP